MEVHISIKSPHTKRSFGSEILGLPNFAGAGSFFFAVSLMSSFNEDLWANLDLHDDNNSGKFFCFEPRMHYHCCVLDYIMGSRKGIYVSRRKYFEMQVLVGYKTSNPSMLTTPSNLSMYSTSAPNSPSIAFTFFLTSPLLEDSKLGYPQLELSLGARSIKSKISLFFGYSGFFIRTCSPVSLINFRVPSICRENELLFAILSTIFLLCKLIGSFLRTSSVNDATLVTLLDAFRKLRYGETFFLDHYFQH